MTDTAEAPAAEPSEGTDNSQAVADAVAESTPEKHDFVLDKYRADGRSESDAMMEQAKGYKELQSKFGSFTGAPEDYEVALSEEMSEHINLEDYSDNVVLDQAKEMARDMGMSNEGFNKFADIYFKGQMADLEAMDSVREEEMKALGNNAERRLGNIQDWAKTNLDSDSSEALIGTLTSASAVQAVEALIAKTRNTQQVTDTPAAPSVSHADIQAKLVAKDEHGNPKMNDPAYAKQVRAMYGQAFGEEPHNVIVGR